MENNSYGYAQQGAPQPIPPPPGAGFKPEYMTGGGGAPPPYNPAVPYPPAQGGYGPPQQAGYAPPPQAGYVPPPQAGYQQQPPYMPPPPQGGYQQQPPFMPPPPMGGMHGLAPGGYQEQNPAFAADDEDIESAGLPKSQFSFDDQSIRRAFIRKVYMIITVQLLVVVALIAAFIFSPQAQQFVYQHSYLYYVSYAVFIISYIAIVCCKSVRRKFPANFIALAILTLSIGYMTAMISSFYSTKIVFIAMGICAAVCLAISLFAMNTKYDFTSWIGVMFVISMVMFFFAIFAIMFRSEIMMAVYGGVMALVFMVYLAIDTQMLMGGKKHEISPEDYIYAATQLFVDIIYIFWMLLQVLGFATGDS